MVMEDAEGVLTGSPHIGGHLVPQKRRDMAPTFVYDSIYPLYRVR